MSEKFTGVTFAKQKVTPSDDAIIRRAILPDGILTGCELSYSGSTLTMAAGHLMICGRQIRMPSVQNWAVVDATSGYARLVLTVDLTRTATKDTFEQVVDSIEYASSEDGFVALEQSDINLSGTRYQIAACVVSLGTGGITGIVSQLAKSAVDGSGALNFKVVGGVTRPSDPAENTIWVNTDQKITSWIFSATQPAEPVEGMVWISIGTNSAVEFNALKKNGIQVYPLAAKQYVSGALVDVPMQIYQGETWNGGELFWFKAGVADSYLGYVNDTDDGADEWWLIGTSGYIQVKVPMEDYYTWIRSKNKVDVTKYNTMKVVFVKQTGGTAKIGLTDKTNVSSFIASKTKSTNGAATVTVDISSVSGSHYLGVYVEDAGIFQMSDALLSIQ